MSKNLIHLFLLAFAVPMGSCTNSGKISLSCTNPVETEITLSHPIKVSRIK